MSHIVRGKDRRGEGGIRVRTDTEESRTGRYMIGRMVRHYYDSKDSGVHVISMTHF